MKILIGTVGLPRSGKTTWARRFSPEIPIVCPDSIRLAIHGNRFIMNAEPFVWAIAKVMVRALFLAGHERVILDATNTTKKRRDEWESQEWESWWHMIPTSAEICKVRAKDDPEILAVIDRMAAQSEPLGPGERMW